MYPWHAPSNSSSCRAIFEPTAQSLARPIYRELAYFCIHDVLDVFNHCSCGISCSGGLSFTLQAVVVELVHTASRRLSSYHTIHFPIASTMGIIHRWTWKRFANHTVAQPKESLFFSRQQVELEGGLRGVQVCRESSTFLHSQRPIL